MKTKTSYEKVMETVLVYDKHSGKMIGCEYGILNGIPVDYQPCKSCPGNGKCFLQTLRVFCGGEVC